MQEWQKEQKERKKWLKKQERYDALQHGDVAHICTTEFPAFSENGDADNEKFRTGQGFAKYHLGKVSVLGELPKLDEF